MTKTWQSRILDCAVRVFVAVIAAGVFVRVEAQETAKGDVFDQFFRFTQKNTRPPIQDLPGETVDPFTGTLSVTQEDLSLPGKAGLDLHIVRTYSSRIWGRSDLQDAEPLLAEKEHSVLGYGWSLHMGRLRSPNAMPSDWWCGGESPVFESNEGSSQVFYRAWTLSPDQFISRDFWRMERNCSYLAGEGGGVCVWSDTGVRYELAQANAFYMGTTLVLPVSAIVDPFGNRISMAYLPESGAVSSITDSYGREILFGYSQGIDGLRLTDLTANNETYQYIYEWVSNTAENTGLGKFPLQGPRRFLTEVRPPEGSSFFYTYHTTAPVAQNQYAIESITYPGGGSTAYTYGAVQYFTGRESLPFSVVTSKTKLDRDSSGAPPAVWSYEYSDPGPDCAVTASCSTDPRTSGESTLHVTRVTRPDLLEDTYTIVGFGFVAANATETERFAYAVGLTAESAEAGREKWHWYEWGFGTSISPNVYSAPSYSDSCGTYFVWDNDVRVPLMLAKGEYHRDGSSYLTRYSDFDAYAQPRTILDDGYQGGFGEDHYVLRATTWSYFAKPSEDDDGATLNIVHGRPLTQQVCVGTECALSSWTYDGPRYSRDSETRSGVTTRFGYDSAGNLRTVTNALNQTLTLSEYVFGVPTNIDYNGAYSVSRTVSWEGNVTSETDGRLHTTGYDYDGLGRLERVTPPGNNNATVYTYAPDGSWIRVARGAYFKNEYLDGFGRVVSSEDSEGVITSSRYDAMGRKWFESYANDVGTGVVGRKLEYDGLGRVTTESRGYRPASDACEFPGACRIELEHIGNCILETVERTSTERPSPVSGVCYESFGDPNERYLRQALDGNGFVWEYRYNPARKIVSVRGPEGAGDRTYVYDEHQFLRFETTAESGTTELVPNAIGQVVTRTDARGVVEHHWYDDPLSRPTGTSYQQGSTEDVARTYDAANNLETLSSVDGGSYTFVYDELNRVTRQTWVFGGREYVTTYHYDPAGCMDEVVYPTGAVVGITCDTANRVVTMNLAGATLVRDVEYHPGGIPRTWVNGNQVTSGAQVDDRGRVVATSAAGVFDLRYGYDGADNVKSITDELDPAFARAMTYDGADRLATAEGPWGLHSYEYDALGNRTLKSSEQDGSVSSVGYTYSSTTNRLTAQAGPETPTLLTLQWGLAGKLSSSSDGQAYYYDGFGRRVLRADQQLQTVYHYDFAGRVIAETLPDGTKLREYFYLGGRLIAVDGCMDTAQSTSCDARQWYHTDLLGSPLARTDGTGAVVAREDYQPWGEVWSQSGVAGDRQYNGRVYDPGTGFHDYGARMYWPEIGRFISADSYMGDPANPASLNRYSYVWNNPYKYTDPTGRSPKGAFKGAMIGGSIGGAIGFLLGGGGGVVVGLATGGLPALVTVPVGAVEGGVAGTAIGAVLGHVIGDFVTGPTVLWANGEPRFIGQPDGTLVDTDATPRGSYDQPDGGRTDVLQEEDHGAGQSHTHDPKVNTNREGKKFINGREQPGRPVSADDVERIQSGEAPRSQPKGR